MKKTYQIFPIMALSTLLAACSGGGGGNGGNHKPQAVNPPAKPAVTKVENKSDQNKTSSNVVATPAEQPKKAVVAAPAEQAKQPEVTKPVEQPKQPEVAAPVEQPKQPEVAKLVEQPKQPEVAAPVEQPKQPEVAKPVEQPKQPEVAAPVEQPKQPEVAKPVEQPKQPEVAAPVEQPKQPEVAAPVEQPKQPEVAVPVEQPKQPEVKAEEPVKPEPQPEKTVWSEAGGFPHAQNEVPYIYLVLNDNAVYDDDPNIVAKENKTIALKTGKNEDPENHYAFYAFDENAYYGFYRDSSNMMNVDNHYVYSFDEKAENKGDLNGLTANYEGKFMYSTVSIPELVMPANVKLRYENGEATGEITSHFDGDVLFDVKSTDNARTLELQPKRDMLDNSFVELNTGPNSPDRAVIDVHFINGKDGTENKALVGKGGNEKYWGVLGAEQK